MRAEPTCLGCTQAAICTEVLDCSNRRSFQKGDVIYGMGAVADGVWQVLDGFVALRSYTEAGNCVTVRLVGARGLFGYRSFVCKDLRSTSAEAITGCRLKHIPGPLLERMIQREPKLAAALLRTLADALRQSGERIVQLASQDACTQLLLFCAELARAQGIEPSPHGYRLTLPILMRDLSELIGIRPESVSRALRRLEAAGVITRPAIGAVVVAAGWRALCEGGQERDGALRWAAAE